MRMFFHSAFRALPLVLTLALTSTAPLSAQSADEVAAISAALEKMRAGDWQAALAAAGPARSMPRDIIEWHRLRASHGTFAETVDFLARRDYWPGLKLLRRRSEAAIPAGVNPADIRAFFTVEQPQTGHGALRLAEALASQGAGDQARAQAVLAWFTMRMSADEEDALLAVYGSHLTPYHWPRLDMLLWRGDSNGARRMLPRVDQAHQKLALARIALRAGADGVNALIDAVPQALQNDPGLAYERFLWRAGKGRNQSAIDLILSQSTSAKTLGEPARWGHWRRVLTRWSMREGQAQQAYRLAANHHIKAGSDRNDLEWLAGYIALRQLNDPATALRHFQTFSAAVDKPISQGRAGYWLGRTYEALGQSAQAQAAYAAGALHQTSFYGQLAAEKAGIAMDPALTGNEVFSGWQQAAFWQNSNMEATRLLQAADELYLALRFSQHLSESLSRGEIGQMTAWAESVDAAYLQVKLGKYVLHRGILLVGPYFALSDLGPPRAGVSPEMALAITRRESEFNPIVQSGVGALGLMQLMPDTARDMTDELGLEFSKARLLSDPAYNIRLGKEYLAFLYDQFGKNPVLISVAYNAGPTRARRWSERMGHPGASNVDVIDWIEHIPFRETRNYVMRVTESLAIYRARLSGKTTPLRLLEELRQR